MVVDKQQIIKLVEDNKETFRNFGVSRIGLFGSFVRGEQNNKSDVDLLVDFLPGQKNYHNFLKLSEFAEKLTGRKVEIVTPQSLSQYIAPYINQDVQYVQTA
jgi:predicted nucleotidyltransferase